MHIDRPTIRIFSTIRRCKMKFSEAVENLVQGKYLTRPEWQKTGEYVALMPGMPHIWKILTQPAPNAGNWLHTLVDLLAEDWLVLDKVDVVQPVAPAQPAQPAPAASAQAAPKAA